MTGRDTSRSIIPTLAALGTDRTVLVSSDDKKDALRSFGSWFFFRFPNHQHIDSSTLLTNQLLYWVFKSRSFAWKNLQQTFSSFYNRADNNNKKHERHNLQLTDRATTIFNGIEFEVALEETPWEKSFVLRNENAQIERDIFYAPRKAQKHPRISYNQIRI
jgi:hypothetical protein